MRNNRQGCLVTSWQVSPTEFEMEVRQSARPRFHPRNVPWYNIFMLGLLPGQTIRWSNSFNLTRNQVWSLQSISVIRY